MGAQRTVKERDVRKILDGIKESSRARLRICQDAKGTETGKMATGLNWQSTTGRKGSAFSKISVKLTSWETGRGITTVEVPGSALKGLLVWHTSLYPLDKDLAEVLRSTRLQVAMFGRDVPEHRRNSDVLWLSLATTPSTIPIAFIFATVHFWQDVNGDFHAQDTTNYKGKMGPLIFARQGWEI